MIMQCRKCLISINLDHIDWIVPQINLVAYCPWPAFIKHLPPTTTGDIYCATNAWPLSGEK